MSADEGQVVGGGWKVPALWDRVVATMARIPGTHKVRMHQKWPSVHITVGGPPPPGTTLVTCESTYSSITLLPHTTGIMLGRMGDSGAPLVSFCQCLNESVMKIVAVAGW